ncbi:tRNA pseudouridine(38-40) synthase TruA [soil metagenome]
MRIAAKVQYSGKLFCGSQYQAGVRTVQSELEKALSLYLRVPTKAGFSGRTDRGVHSFGQIVHFDVEQDELDLWRFCWALNGILPNDISISSVKVVDDKFHARFTARKREYVYRILNRPQRSALLKETHYFVYRPLDVELMKASTAALLGSHDFSGFRSTNADKTSSICDVTRAELLNLGEGRLEFWIAANHFVYNMVRIIVGTLVEIGLGKRAPESLAEALNAGDRNLAGPTAPSWGLTLNSVEYPEAHAIFELDS